MDSFLHVKNSHDLRAAELIAGFHTVLIQTPSQTVCFEEKPRAGRADLRIPLTRHGGQRVTTPNTTSLWPVCFPKGLGYSGTSKLIHSCQRGKEPDHTAAQVRGGCRPFCFMGGDGGAFTPHPPKNLKIATTSECVILSPVHCLLLACYVCDIVMSSAKRSWQAG